MEEQTAATSSIGTDLSTIEVKYIENATATALKVAATTSENVLTYQWYSSTGNNTINGTKLNGETGATFTPLTTSIGTTYYYCVVHLQELVVSAGTSVTTWFTNLTNKVKIATIATSVTVTIAGTPTKALTRAMSIKMPATSLTTSTINLTVTANADAKFEITTATTNLSSATITGVKSSYTATGSAIEPIPVRDYFSKRY